MNDKVRLDFIEGDDHAAIRVDVRDPALVGRPATLKVLREARLHCANAIDQQQVLLEQRLRLEAGAQRFALPADPAQRWVYHGRLVDLRTLAILEVDDAALADRRFEAAAPWPMFAGPLAPETSAGQVDPDDRFSVLENIKAVPWRNRLAAIALLLVGIPLLLANAVLGWNDEYETPGNTIFYEHRDGDGESQSPLVNALLVSGGLGFALWMALRSQLRRYMEISAVASGIPAMIEPCTRLSVREIFSGRSQVALEDCVLRVVAFNLEKGQYKHSHKNRTEIREVSRFARAAVLFEQRLPHVPAGAQLAEWVDGALDFGRLFTALHPPVALGPNHGIDVHWKVQLLHPQLVDQEVMLPVVDFRFPARKREVPSLAAQGEDPARA